MTTITTRSRASRRRRRASRSQHPAFTGLPINRYSAHVEGLIMVRRP